MKEMMDEPTSNQVDDDEEDDDDGRGWATMQW